LTSGSAAELERIRNDQAAYEDALATIGDGFSKRLCAVRTRIVAMEDGMGALKQLGLERKVRFLRVLGGRPVTCHDVRLAAGDARDAGELLVADNTLATSFGCQATRLGAHIAYEELDHVVQREGSNLMAISVSRDAVQEVSDLGRRLKCIRRPTAEEVAELVAGLEDFDERRRAAFDCAQVIAYYLLCHPKVAHVYYPGLPHDPSFSVASGIIRNGFGSCVDFELDLADEGAMGRVLEQAAEVLDPWVPGGDGVEFLRLAQGEKDPLHALIRLRCGHARPLPFVSKLERVLAVA
jgi:cystathionine gamma-synthase